MPTTWDLPPVRDGRPAPDDLVQMRVTVAGFNAATPVEPGVSVDEHEFAGVACTVVATPAPARTLLYFHGGGYRLGAATGWTAFASRVATAADARVVLADYRLAPEHPFPAALHDATAVYGELLAEGPGGIGAESWWAATPRAADWPRHSQWLATRQECQRPSGWCSSRRGST